MGGRGIIWVVTVWAPAPALRVIVRLVVTTRRTRFTVRLGAAAWRERALCALALAGLPLYTLAAAGTSATCIAPVPISAPPQVQAHNFARAILTDISFSFPSGANGRRALPVGHVPRYLGSQLAASLRCVTAANCPNLCERRNAINPVA